MYLRGSSACFKMQLRLLTVATTMTILTTLALASTQLLLGPQLVSAGASESCPADGPLSCHNSTAVADLCCFNAPGGQLLQTQFWDTDPAEGPADSWTVHGL